MGKRAFEGPESGPDERAAQIREEISSDSPSGAGLQDEEHNSVAVPVSGGQDMPLRPSPPHSPDNDKRRETFEVFDMLAAVLQQDACGLSAAEAVERLSSCYWALRGYGSVTPLHAPRGAGATGRRTVDWDLAKERMLDSAFALWWKQAGRKAAVQIARDFQGTLPQDEAVGEAYTTARHHLEHSYAPARGAFSNYVKRKMRSALIDLSRTYYGRASDQGDGPRAVRRRRHRAAPLDDANVLEVERRHQRNSSWSFEDQVVFDHQKRQAGLPREGEALSDGDRWTEQEADTGIGQDTIRYRWQHWRDGHLGMLRRIFKDSS
jgi:hypothetical protein